MSGSPRIAHQKSSFQLRDYQAEAVEAFFRVIAEEPSSSPLIVIPTGGGKGPLCAVIGERFIRATGKRVIAATHVRELVRQNYEQVRKVAPSIHAGIYSAGENRKDQRAQFTSAGVQSICRVSDRFNNVGMLLIDEAHLLQHGEDGQYHQLIKGLRERNPGLVIGGLTATPWRLNSGNLCEPYKGQAPLFTEVAYEKEIADLVADGYLTPLIARRTGTKLDTSDVGRRGGEFIDSQLDKAVNTDALNTSIVSETIETGHDRRSILVFAVSVDHARRLSEMFQAKGVAAAYVSGETPKTERDGITAAFKRGALRVLVNCAVLTTGFDAPNVDSIVFARPTNSPGLYLQMAGRGTRVMYAPGHDISTREGRLAAIAAGGKRDCLVLDFAGNTGRHGLIDMVKGVHKRKGEADASDDLRECPECQTINPRAADACVCCGHVFPKGGGGVTAAEREAKLSFSNLADRVMTEADGLWWSPINQAMFATHRKDASSPLILKLSYRVLDEKGADTWATEWLCFSHGEDSWATKKAKMEWRKRAGTRPPASTEEAVARIRELNLPSRVRLRRNDRWLNVVSVQI